MKKRRKKSELKKLQDKLWELCKVLTRQEHGHQCYTCGEWVEFPHTGHFITDSTCSTELSYDLKNLRPQCYPCNIHKSGNWVIFESNLIRDHGEKYVKELKKRNQETKGKSYREDWYEEKIKEYEKLVIHS